MSSRVAEKLITNALRNQFSVELRKIGIHHLQIELRKKKTIRGVSHFIISFIRSPDMQTKLILSEGEHRCVAIAAFLAEVVMTEGHSAIVFDDPVSSLDHHYREAVAERLAELSKNRQIIVFTHDITFLFLLNRICKNSNLDEQITIRGLDRTSENTGVVRKTPPFHAQRIEDILEGLQAKLYNEKILFIDGKHEKWEESVDTIVKRLRLTWERAVEEIVDPVLKRLSNKVQMGGLIKLTVLTDKDCNEVYNAHGRLSEILHTSAESLRPNIQTPEAIQYEIDVLKIWYCDIKQRQQKIKNLKRKL